MLSLAREQVVQRRRSTVDSRASGGGQDPWGPVAVVRISGRDPTGAVVVVLDSRGLPESIDLAPNWRRLVGAEGLAAAVTQAGHHAVEARNEADAPQLRAWLHEVTEAVANAHPEDAPVRSMPSHFTPERAELISRAFEATLRLEERRLRGAAGGGTVGQGRLTLSLDDQDCLVCEADAEWVGRQDPDELSVAFDSALASLRADRAETDRLQQAASTAVAQLLPRANHDR
jgi:hypothetical protein